MRFLVNLYYTPPFYRTSTCGQNHAHCIQIFTVIKNISVTVKVTVMNVFQLQLPFGNNYNQQLNTLFDKLFTKKK